jgi:alcohol dehydrogenase class IV
MLTTPLFSGRFSFPTAVEFGPGAVRAAAPEIALLGRRALVVSDAGLAAGPVVARVVAALAENGVAAAVFDGVHPNPTEADVRAGVGALAAFEADLVVAVGGGSPIDAAKAIRLLAGHSLPLAAFDARAGSAAAPMGPLLPMVAIPTTAGTGSEVSRSAVISLAADGRKLIVFGPPLLPTLAVCDPELTLDLPPRLTAATGADALTHAVEAYLARGFHPPADALALQSVAYVFRYLRRAYAIPGDLEARVHMMLASLLGAMAFQKGLGACHAMAHALTTVHHLHHGLANAVCLPAVVEVNGAAAPARLRDLARAAGSSSGAQWVADLRGLLADVGLPATLRAAGVDAPDYAALVPLAVADGCLADNLVDLGAADLRALYERVAA